MIAVMNASEANTPMIRQYQDIKSRCRDAILFFRLGDFYEMFYDDAKIASKELELTLTGRGEGEKRMPMCGVPYHAADNYISKLLFECNPILFCLLSGHGPVNAVCQLNFNNQFILSQFLLTIVC